MYLGGIGPNGFEQGIFAFNPDGVLLWRYPGEHVGGTPLIGLDGTIIAAAGHELIGIVEHGSMNGGYDGAPWPTVRGDRASTGRAGG